MKQPRFSLPTLVLFVCFVASGFGLGWRWEPWVQNDSSYETYKAQFLMNPMPILSGTQNEQILIFKNRMIQVDFDRMVLLIVEKDSRQILSTVAKLPGLSGAACGYFLENGSVIVIHDGSSEKDYTWIFHRRRPEYWYGPAWLWEFWATVIFTLALAASLWKDWRRLGV